jgi:hypothetical protein
MSINQVATEAYARFREQTRLKIERNSEERD